jgi:hypothetical protein
MNPSLTAAAMAQNLIERARKLQTFRIVRQLDDHGMIFSKGPVPYDIRINKENVMYVTVHALTLKEANQLVDTWIASLNEDDL